jgi:hypothetical protein
LSVPDRAYTPPVANNMAEAPVPQQTKSKFANLSVFKNFIKFQNFQEILKFPKFQKNSKFS